MTSLPDTPPPWKVVVRSRRHERLWGLVEEETVALADRLGRLSPEHWDADSRCDGWKVRHVLGHLVHLTEGYQGQDEAMVVARSANGGRRRRPGDMHVAFSIRAKELGRTPAAELVERLRRAAGSRYNGLPAVALSEILIHGDDMLQPLGMRGGVRVESAVPALDLMRWVNRLVPGFAFGGHRHRGVRLVADDVDWSAGHGPEARGAALDLLALLANRNQAMTALTGAGAVKLRGQRRQ